MKKLAALFFLAMGCSFAQTQWSIQAVTVAPTGACSDASLMRQVIGVGLYQCISGTWTSISGGGAVVLQTAVQGTAASNVLRDWLSVKDHGATGNSQKDYVNGAMTASSNVFSSASVLFIPSYVGESICVVGAGVAGAQLCSTIVSISSGNAVLAASASTTVTGAQFYFGTDDTAAIQATINTIGATDPNAYAILFPPGVYWTSSTLLIGHRRVYLIGQGTIGAHGATILNVQSPNSDIIDASDNLIDLFGMANLQLQGDGAGTGTGNGVNIGNTAGSLQAFDSPIYNCWFTAIPAWGVNGELMSNYRFDKDNFENSGGGLLITKGSNNQVGDTNRFYSDGIGVEIGAGSSWNTIHAGFSQCGHGSSNTSAAILLAGGAAESRANSITGCTFNKSNGHDIASSGTASLGSHTGFTGTTITGNTSDFGQQSFLYANTLAGAAVVANNIKDSSQSSNGGYAVIDITGTSDSNYLSENKTQCSSTNCPSYSLLLDTSTTLSKLGFNSWSGSTTGKESVLGTLDSTGIQGPTNFDGAITIGIPGTSYLSIYTGSNASLSVPAVRASTAGALILSAGGSNKTYINYDGGNGLVIGNGSSAQEAYISSIGAATFKGSSDLASTIYAVYANGIAASLQRAVQTSVTASACGGVATLASGTVTVSTTCPIGASDLIQLTRRSINSSTALGSLGVGTITSGTSFVINSYTAVAGIAVDNSIVSWEIVKTF